MRELTLVLLFALGAIAGVNGGGHNQANGHSNNQHHNNQGHQNNQHHTNQGHHNNPHQSQQHSQHAAAAGVAAAAGSAAAGGKRPILHGVNRAGSEFACIKGDGIFKEGPVDDSSIQSMLSWKINVVRVPLNEDCWLGKNVPNPEHGGKNYQNAIKEFVSRLRSHKLHVILDLHWTEGMYTGKGQGACAEVPAKCQKPMPDLENAPTFWKEVATMFKDDAEGVIFDLFNEPFPDMKFDNKADAWLCWQKGGDACAKGQFEYKIAGMEDLVKAVRDAGAENLLMLGGLTWANDLSQWLEHVPKGVKNIAASMHSYDFNECNDEGCWDKGIGKIAKAGYPVIVGEIGEHGCKHTYIDKIMPYLDKHQISYLAWTWNKWDCSGGPALIREFDGSPTDFGVGFKQHLATLPAA